MRFEENGVNMAVEMIYGDKRLSKSKGQHFAVGHSDQQRPNQTGSVGYGNCVHIG